MKKKYIKPTLFIENFMMDVSIANSCEMPGYELEAMLDALRALPGNENATIEELIAILNEQEDGEWCYHTSQGTNVFNS